MNYARLIAEGVGSWLQFEHACGRSSLFSEKYLTHPIGQIISARSSNRVQAEYVHPILAELSEGPGRRAEIDFVVCDPYPKIALAVESKWIGHTRPSIDRVIWDLIRLELIAHAYGARCFFVLGGTRADLDDYFKRKDFVGMRKSRIKRPLLRTDSNLMHRTALVPLDGTPVKLMKKLFEPYQDFQFPHYIMSRRSDPFPNDGPNNRFQIYVWEISSRENRETFKPKNSRHYSPDGSSQRDWYRQRAKKTDPVTELE